MEKDKEGNLIHEDYTSSFYYEGTQFIVDKLKDSWLITERNFLIKERGDTFSEAKTNIKREWDRVKHKYQN